MKKMSILLLSSTALLFSCTKENNTISNTKTENPTVFKPSETENSDGYNWTTRSAASPSGGSILVCDADGNNCKPIKNGIEFKPATPVANRLVSAIQNGSVSDFVSNDEFHVIFPGLADSEILHNLKTGTLTVQLAPTKDKDVMFVITKSDATTINPESIILAVVLEDFYK